MLHADYFKNNNNNNLSLSVGPDWEFIISGNQSVKVPSSFSVFEAKAFHPHTQWPDCLQMHTSTCIYIMHQFKNTPSGAPNSLY